MVDRVEGVSKSVFKLNSQPFIIWLILHQESAAAYYYCMIFLVTDPHEQINCRFVNSLQRLAFTFDEIMVVRLRWKPKVLDNYTMIMRSGAMNTLDTFPFTDPRDLLDISQIHVNPNLLSRLRHTVKTTSR